MIPRTLAEVKLVVKVIELEQCLKICQCSCFLCVCWRLEQPLDTQHTVGDLWH